MQSGLRGRVGVQGDSPLGGECRHLCSFEGQAMIALCFNFDFFDYH